MSAPTNTSASSAIDLGTLPASVTQNVYDAGTTYQVWYSYTAQSADVVVSLWGYSSNFPVISSNAYFVETYVYTGPASSPVLLMSNAGRAQRPMQVPVTPGTTYYFKFRQRAGFFPNPTPAVLNVAAETFAQQSAPIGSIIVPDDTTSFPLVLLDETADDTPLRYINPFPGGDSGDALASGVMLYEVFDINAGTSTLGLYDDQFNLIATPSVAATTRIKIRTNHGLDLFYVTQMGGTAAKVYTVDGAGAVGGTTWTLTGTTLSLGQAASNDGTIFYYSSGTNSAVKRWNLNTDTAMTDLVASRGATYRIKSMLMLGDDSLCVQYAEESGVTMDVKRYSAAGATLSTYTLPGATGTTGFSGMLGQLAYALDDPNSFWAWYHLSGVSRFRNIKVSDGSVLTQRDSTEYEQGVYEAAATATPTAMFGNSASCPFLILRALFPSSSTGTIIVIKQVIPPDDTTVFDFTAGGGLMPTTFSLSNGEQQVFNSVPTGSGYSVAEDPNAGFTTTVVVSNGSPVDDISVAEDEIVTVTFTNATQGTQNFDVIPIKRRWLRRSPVYSDENKRIVYRRFWLDIQPGQGNTVDPGVDPQVYFRVSGDWGSTWSSNRVQSAGTRGQFNRQVVFYNCGQHRNAVFEVYGSDPCPVFISGAYIKIEPGRDD